MTSLAFGKTGGGSIMEKPTTKLSARDRVILFCVATGIDHGSVHITDHAMQSMAIRGFIALVNAIAAAAPAAALAASRNNNFDSLAVVIRSIQVAARDAIDLLMVDVLQQR
jgi:hypothetical protein